MVFDPKAKLRSAARPSDSVDERIDFKIRGIDEVFGGRGASGISSGSPDFTDDADTQTLVHTATDDPTVDDDGYVYGTIWVRTDSPNQNSWICIDNSDGAAIWDEIGASSGTVSGSGTDNHVARFDGTADVQDSGWILADTDKMTVADGALDITQDSIHTGNALRVYRNLGGGDTNSPLVSFINDNAGDNQDVLKIQQNGNANGISILSANSGDDGVIGISVSVAGNTAETKAVVGLVNSTHNSAYGGSFDQTKVGLYADYDEGAAPAAAPSGDVRTYALTGGLMRAIDDDSSSYGDYNLSNILTIQSKTGAYTALKTDELILCNPSGGTFTVKLYAVANQAGRVIIIKNTDMLNSVTVDGDGANIDGVNLATVPPKGMLMVVTDGSNWHIVSN